jgi:outer membrane murein-binding lipoprotein Lpp
MANGMIRLVEGMPFTPHVCVSCGNRSEEESVDLDNEIDFGDQAYLCGGCARVVGELVGLMDPEHNIKLEAKNDQLKEQVKELTAERDTLQNRIDKMIDGKRALKEAKRAKQGSSN